MRGSKWSGARLCSPSQARFSLRRSAPDAAIAAPSGTESRSYPEPCPEPSFERDEIAASAKASDGDIDAMAAKLEVSPRGLRLRMRQLGL